MDRRRFLMTGAGAGAATLGLPWIATAGAATDDEIAYANFGASVEFLVKDFYGRALEAKALAPPANAVLRRGRIAASQHVKALSELLAAAGDVAPVEEDFEFQWPASTFRSKRAIVSTGVGVLGPLLGAYQSASAGVTEPSYRLLYASLTASVGEQIGGLAWVAPRVGT